jgi:YVTN family beta-propeller protein
VVPLTEVTPDLALSQPTDVLLVETGGPVPEIQKVFLTAYHSDKVAVLHPDSSVHGGWRINQIPISIPELAKDYGMAGPRGLAFSPNAVDPATPTEPGLVFCANRLSNSISVINPHTEAVIAEFTLQHDPTPKRIRKGRKFLYSAAEFSGNGMVSCASCHVDGRTDGLNWNLGDLNLGPAIDPWFHDGNGESVESIPNFPSDKGRLATQTLQGLVNYRVNPQAQHLFSNAPYHWRGDKRGLVDFNEAFVNLQGMANIGLPENPKGVTDSEMEEFATFLNTIVHPGNFEQFYTRGTTGSLGADPNDPTQGSGALLGMKIYHVQPVEPRSCVQCHSLPDGSTNTATLAEVVEGTVGSSIQLHPFEAAATRNLVQREGILHRGFKIPGPPLTLTSNSGLLHAGELLLGVALSINDFLGNVFLGAMPGPTEADAIRQIEAVIEFQRQFDSGVAPLVGFGWTYVPGHPLNLALLRVLEEQVTQANLGLAVYTRSNGVEKGYYYDFSVFPPAYREVGTANFIPGEALDQIALEDDAVVILQATPMGSERRVANLEGKHDELKDKDNPPSAITLQPMAPGTAWVHITKFTAGVDPTAGAISLASLRALQDSVIGPNFGVPSLRHEPPRKFRVTGDNIRLGASLMLGMLDKDNPETIHYLWMPIFPTRNVADRRIIWETEAEADAMVIMTLLNGGPWAPGVTEVLHGILPPTTPLDPLNWNTFLVAVMNEDKSINEVVQWQTLTVQDGR